MLISRELIFSVVLACCFILSGQSSEASVVSNSGFTEFFAPKVESQQVEPSNAFWPPVYSLLVPGLDQWMSGEYGPASVYTGTALLGAGLATNSGYEPNRPIYTLEDAESQRDRRRVATYGADLYVTSGFLSAYHAFRHAVVSHQQSGTQRFQFLEAHLDENVSDLLVAPFEFSFATRWTTLIPLAGITAYVLSGSELGSLRAPQFDDQAFAIGRSYNAGVGEEAFFRGWMHPYAYSVTKSSFWSNAIQGTVFGFAHRSGDIPWVQLAAGYYFGWLAERNDWSLRENIFLHTWWDIIVFTANEAQGHASAIYIPVIQTHW